MIEMCGQDWSVYWWLVNKCIRRSGGMALLEAVDELVWDVYCSIESTSVLV